MENLHTVARQRIPIVVTLPVAMGEEKRMDTKWFRARLEESGVTQRHLAKTLDLDPAAVSYMLRGKRKMQMAEAAEIARMIGTPIDEVLLHAGIDIQKAPAGADVAIVGTIQAASGEIQHTPDGKRTRKAPAVTGLPKGASALRIEGEGAEAGWTLYYVPRDQVEAGAVGQLAVVTLPGRRGQYVRIVERGDEAGTFNLRAWPRGRDLDNARILAANPVIWIKP